MAKGTLVFEDGTIYRVSFDLAQAAQPVAPPPPKVPITAINCLCSHTAEHHDSQTGYCRASDSGYICPCREFRFTGAPATLPPQRESATTPQGTQGRLMATEAQKLVEVHTFDPGDSIACRTCGLDYYAHTKENR